MTFKLSAWFTGVLGGCFLFWFIRENGSAFFSAVWESLASTWVSMLQTCGNLGMFAIFLVLTVLLGLVARLVEEISIG